MSNILQLHKSLSRRPVMADLSDTRIRSFSGDTDIDAWLELRDQTFARQRLGVRRWTRDDFAAELTSRWWWRPDRMWLAETTTPLPGEAGKGVLVGSVILAMRGEPDNARPVVHWLMVTPKWRHRGIGQMLMAHLEAAAWDAGHREVFLETHAAWEAAAKFYAAAGYV